MPMLLLRPLKGVRFRIPVFLLDVLLACVLMGYLQNVIIQTDMTWVAEKEIKVL